MVNEQEIKVIMKRFNRLIAEGKIAKPKLTKKDFFKNKAEDSLQLAKEILEKKEHLDWAVNIAYYSMFYNATSLLAKIGVDMQDADEGIHVLTYQALVYYFHILHARIEERYLEDFKSSMEESNLRLKTLAKRKSEEMLAGYKRAKDERAKVTYELGQTAELQSATSAVQRAEAFDLLAEKIRLS